MGVSRDLSERLRAQGEQRRLESQLQQAAKMESIGRLAGGVAHDFNNLLTAIMGNLEIAVEEAPVDSPVRNLLREARRAARSAADLTGKLLMFSRKQSFEPRHLLLSELLERLRGALQRMVGEDVHIALTAAPDLWEIAADPSLIEQVIVNLAANARDAMPRGGRLGFSALNVRLVADDPAGAPGVPPGEFVLLSVADTGVGISNEVKAHLFEPFFTTKEVGKGTGLGLATSYGAVTRSGGHISVDSSPGRGTTFRLWFPRAASGDERRRPSSPSYLRGGTETVLLVDDAPDVREIAARMLTRLGYSVLTADRVESALDVARATPPPLHLLLTDIVMPGGSGRELADRLAEIHPETRVLLTSGYDQEAVGRREALAPGAPFIAKPYSMAELGEKIRAVLEAPSTYGAVAGT
jgi:nitrogen-specific signal transduction histidine kinase/ActR/RegA family two-component response regulator